MMYASRLYSYLCDDPLIDFLELKYLHLKQSPDEDYDLDALQGTRRRDTQQQRLSAALSWFAQRQVQVSCSIVHTFHLLRQKSLYAVQSPPLRSTRYCGSPDFVLSREAFAHLDVACSTNYGCLFVSDQEETTHPSLYNVAKWYLAQKALDYLTEDHTLVFVFYTKTSQIKPVCYNSTQLEIIEDAIEWIEQLPHRSESWSIEDNVPKDIRLLPNLSRKSPGWDSLKETLAQKWGELTQICHIGAQTRKVFHSQRIYTIHQPTFLPYLQQQDLDPICKLIGESITRKVVNKVVSLPRLESLHEKTILSVDMESYAGHWSDGTLAGEVMIGCLILREKEEPRYVMFFDQSSKQVKEQFANFLSLFPDPLILHYTEADKSVIPDKYRTLDVHPLVRIRYQTSPSFRQFGIMKFGLKHICSKLFGDLYGKCVIKNGCEASAALYHAVRYGVSTTRGSKLVEEVREYNKVDVYALAYLYLWLTTTKT